MGSYSLFSCLLEFLKLQKEAPRDNHKQFVAKCNEKSAFSPGLVLPLSSTHQTPDLHTSCYQTRLWSLSRDSDRCWRLSYRTRLRGNDLVCQLPWPTAKVSAFSPPNSGIRTKRSGFPRPDLPHVIGRWSVANQLACSPQDSFLPDRPTFHFRVKDPYQSGSGFAFPITHLPVLSKSRYLFDNFRLYTKQAIAVNLL